MSFARTIGMWCLCFTILCLVPGAAFAADPPAPTVTSGVITMGSGGEVPNGTTLTSTANPTDWYACQSAGPYDKGLALTSCIPLQETTSTTYLISNGSLDGLYIIAAPSGFPQSYSTAHRVVTAAPSLRGDIYATVGGTISNSMSASLWADPYYAFATTNDVSSRTIVASGSIAMRDSASGPWTPVDTFLDWSSYAGYTIPDGTVGKYVQVTWTATDVYRVSRTTTAEAQIQCGAQWSPRPSLQATGINDGDVLTLAGGTVTHSGGCNLTTTYQWLRYQTDGSNPVKIDGATGSSYTLTASDVGHTVEGDATLWSGTNEIDWAWGSTPIVGTRPPVSLDTRSVSLGITLPSTTTSLKATKGSIPVTITTDRSTTVTITATVPGSIAGKYHIRASRTKTIGSATGTTVAGVGKAFSIKLSKSVQRAAKKAKVLTVTLQIMAVDALGNAKITTVNQKVSS